MNPMTNMKNVKKLSEQELHRSSKSSWHDQYRDSAWIFVGGLPYDLTEGDIICVFSQYGEIVNINLVRDKSTGKQKGFCFVCYEDQRSTVLAVDNLNGIKILSRTIRVDHVNDYKMPKQKEVDAETKKIYDEGCGPGVKHEKKPEPLPIPTSELPAFARENEPPPDGFRLPPRLPIGAVKLEKLDDDDEELSTKVKIKKEKKHKKDKKRKKSKKKHRKKVSSSESSSSSSESDTEEDVQKTNHDADASAKTIDVKPTQENSRYGKQMNKLPDSSSRDKHGRQRDDKYRRYDERKRTHDDRRDRDESKRYR